MALDESVDEAGDFSSSTDEGVTDDSADGFAGGSTGGADETFSGAEEAAPFLPVATGDGGEASFDGAGGAVGVRNFWPLPLRPRPARDAAAGGSGSGAGAIGACRIGAGVSCSSAIAGVEAS